MSMTLSPNGSEVIAGCSSGNIYRCLLQPLSPDLITTSHTSAVTAISCGSFKGDKSGLFATGTANGELRVWDIADYACVAYKRESKSGGVMCLGIMDNNSMLVSGWSDGSMRCHDMTLHRLVWHIPMAHRDGVRSVAICDEAESRLQFMVSVITDVVYKWWNCSVYVLYSDGIVTVF